MQNIPWPYIGRAMPGQFGGLHFLKKNKNEMNAEQRIPKIIGKGISRPKSVDAMTMALQQKMNNLTISANGYHLAKRPVSSSPGLSSTQHRNNSPKNSDTLSNTDGYSYTSSNTSGGNVARVSSKSSHSSGETNSESDDSRGVGRRAVGESYPKFNINTHNATRIFTKKETFENQKESCGFLRCVMSELDRKERAEELIKKKAKKNASFNKEQTRKIERENQILLEKLIRVEKKSKRPPAVTIPAISSNRKKEMDRESRRIKKDNARLYMKIKFARPSDDLLRASEPG